MLELFLLTLVAALSEGLLEGFAFPSFSGKADPKRGIRVVCGETNPNHVVVRIDNNLIKTIAVNLDNDKFDDYFGNLEKNELSDYFPKGEHTVSSDPEVSKYVAREFVVDSIYHVLRGGDNSIVNEEIDKHIIKRCDEHCKAYPNELFTLEQTFHCMEELARQVLIADSVKFTSSQLEEAKERPLPDSPRLSGGRLGIAMTLIPIKFVKNPETDKYTRISDFKDLLRKRFTDFPPVYKHFVDSSKVKAVTETTSYVSADKLSTSAYEADHYFLFTDKKNNYHDIIDDPKLTPEVRNGIRLSCAFFQLHKRDGMGLPDTVLPTKFPLDPTSSFLINDLKKPEVNLAFASEPQKQSELKLLSEVEQGVVIQTIKTFAPDEKCLSCFKPESKALIEELISQKSTLIESVYNYYITTSDFISTPINWVRTEMGELHHGYLHFQPLECEHLHLSKLHLVIPYWFQNLEKEVVTFLKYFTSKSAQTVLALPNMWAKIPHIVKYVIRQRAEIKEDEFGKVNLTVLNKLNGLSSEEQINYVHTLNKKDLLVTKTSEPKKEEKAKPKGKTQTPKSTPSSPRDPPSPNSRLQTSLKSKKFDNGVSYAEVLKNKEHPNYSEAKKFEEKKKKEIEKKSNKTTKKPKDTKDLTSRISQLEEQLKVAQQSSPVNKQSSIAGKTLNGPKAVTEKVKEVFGTLDLQSVLQKMNTLIPKDRGMKYNFSVIAPYLCISDGKPSLTVPIANLGKSIFVGQPGQPGFST